MSETNKPTSVLKDLVRQIVNVVKPYMESTEEVKVAEPVKTKITIEDIEANIAQTHYFTASDGCHAVYQGGPEFQAVDKSLDRLTFCVLVLRNGFVVTGESACVHAENFNIADGRKYARENAISKIWALMGYELRSKLFPA